MKPQPDWFRIAAANTSVSRDKAVTEHASRVVEVEYEPIFKDFRGEPSFHALLRRIGL